MLILHSAFFRRLLTSKNSYADKSKDFAFHQDIDPDVFFMLMEVLHFKKVSKPFSASASGSFEDLCFWLKMTDLVDYLLIDKKIQSILLKYLTKSNLNNPLISKEQFDKLKDSELLKKLVIKKNNELASKVMKIAIHTMHSYMLSYSENSSVCVSDVIAELADKDKMASDFPLLMAFFKFDDEHREI